MSPKADVSEERQAQILDAAEEVFAKKGIDTARMDDIVLETGLSKGALYWYFKSKDDIITAIMERMFQREFKAFNELDKTSMSATDQLKAFADLTIKEMNNFTRLMPLAYEFLALAFHNRTVQKVIHQYFDYYIDILIPIIQRGIDQREFQPGNAQDMAVALGAVFEGTLLLQAYDKDLVQPEHHLRTGFELLLKGMLLKPK